jgi:hypothetical protein
MELLLLGARLFLGVVFLSASIPKLFAAREFRRALTNYQLLPVWLVAPVGTWLPRFELLIAAALLTGVAITITATIAGLALLAFSVAVGVNLARGRSIECGCFGGASPRRITWRLALRDVVLAAAAFAVAAHPPAIWTAVAWPVTTSGSASATDALAILLVSASTVAVEHLVVEWVRLRTIVSAENSDLAVSR